MRWFVALVALAACSRAPAPKSPADAVKADILLAEEAEKARNHDEARRYYGKAVAEATDPASKHIAHREYGETLATWGEIEAADKHLEAAVRADASDPIAWQMLGIVRHKRGDINNAIIALQKSKELAPKAWIPRRDLAVVYWKQGQRDLALAEYKAMLDLELPARMREKVEWAISVLGKPEPVRPPPEPKDPNQLENDGAVVPQPPADPPSP
jgi:tetratricopeptide (TPR) repeat protein